MEKVLSLDFYRGHDPCEIAKNLLGKLLITDFSGARTSGFIVETEAYKAPEDLACHAKGNKRTSRTETMFGQPGIAYVYKCYGIHDLFNVVTAEESMAHAVLIRAIEPVENVKLMMEKRGMDQNRVQLVNGPGKLTQALGITTIHDRMDVTTKGGIWIEDYRHIASARVVAGPRVGMSKHTKHSGHWPWRYRIKDNPWTSLPHRVVYGW